MSLLYKYPENDSLMTYQNSKDYSDSRPVRWIKNFRGSGNNFGYSAKGLSLGLSNYGEGATISGRYNKSGGYKGLLYRGGVGFDKNLKTGRTSKSFGGQVEYGTNIGHGNLSGEVHYDNRDGEVSKGASISGRYKGLGGNLGIQNQNGQNDLSGSLNQHQNYLYCL